MTVPTLAITGTGRGRGSAARARSRERKPRSYAKWNETLRRGRPRGTRRARVTLYAPVKRKSERRRGC